MYKLRLSGIACLLEFPLNTMHSTKSSVWKNDFTRLAVVSTKAWYISTLKGDIDSVNFTIEYYVCVCGLLTLKQTADKNGVME